MNKAMRYLAVAGSALFLVTACAQERDAINRVQPNVVSKTFFVGEDLVDITDDPEFYMRGTLVDIGYGAAQDGLFTSTYAQQVSRIRWEITEDYLNARLAYERIAGSDGKGNQWNGLTKKTTNDGQIAASFKIISHFDISRSYNPVTGEELNIIEENSSDRPWYERKYMRVDWSENLATDAYDYDTLALLGVYGGVEYEPLSYTVLDPNDADAPVYDEKGGYFDVTNKAFAKPQLLDLSHLGWGIDSFPACMLEGNFAGGTNPYGNCNPVELTIRLAFKKVVDTDYEPKHVDGKRFQAFGMFDVNYRGYDRNYGMQDSKWFRFGAKYNIWKRSHYYDDPEAMTGWVPCATTDTSVTPTGKPSSDPNRDENGNGTADECEAVTAKTGVPGSQCDTFKQRCTLPFRIRESVTIPWHLVDEGDPELELFDPINQATVEWDMAMKTAVQTARLTECIRTGADEDKCREQFPMWHGQQDDNQAAVRMSYALDACHRSKGWDKAECDNIVAQMADDLGNARGDKSDTAAIAAVLKLPPVVVLCHSPVIKSDHKACGEVGTTSRFGDLRFNNVQVLGTPEEPSAWGIMVDADDPVTGEKVAASINVWDYVTDVAATQLVDIVRYVSGEISTEDITNGKYIRDWVSANTRAGSGVSQPVISKEEVNRRLASLAKITPEKMAEIKATPVSNELREVINKIAAQNAEVAVSSKEVSANMLEASARMAGARGKPSEAKLFNKAIMQLAGANAAVATSGVMADVVSPLAANNPLVASRLAQMKENALAARGACIMAGGPEPTTMIGLAQELLKKFPAAEGEDDAGRVARYKKMANYIHRKYTYGTLVHEMGHSWGLRHNFVSSAAPLHFRPQYWQLRTKNGTLNTICDTAVDDGDSCVGPRYYDPVSKEEQDNMIMMFTQSSIMDYAGDVALDFLGIGAYDVAAVRHHYGDVVSVFQDKSKIKPSSSIGIGMLQNMDTFGGLFGVKYCEGSGSSCSDFHYSELQKRWKVIDKCYSVEPKEPSWWKENLDGKYSPLLDGLYVKVDGQYTECRQMPVDYVTWNDLSEHNQGSYRAGPCVDPMNRVRVPYSFATDNWADLGNASVYRHDMGADTYEIADFLISMYENRHIFDNYRRGRSTFNVRSAAGRSFGRYNEKLLGLATGLGFYANLYKTYSQYQGYNFDTLWPSIIGWNLQDNALTASMVFDHFVRQLVRPEAGPHYFSKNALEPEVLRSGIDPDGNFDEEKQTAVIIPNGSTGYLKEVGFGGRPLESAYDEDQGEYYSDYTANCGSYYDKINVAILLSESEDRFVSSSRTDYYDARWRAAGMADVYPDGFRRVIANALTGDRSILAPVVAADSSGKILLDSATTNKLDADAAKYPALPIGWKSFWMDDPEVCFTSGGRRVCKSDYASGSFSPIGVDNVVPVDPQIGWEVQKFIIANTLAYIPANSKSNWLDMMTVYRVGKDADPGIERRIEWTDPVSGASYIARSYGKECLFGTGSDCAGGKIVEKGIAARVLEYANELTAKGYVLDTANYPASAENGNRAGFNKYGRAVFDTYSDGTPIVKADSQLVDILNGGANEVPVSDCSKADYDAGNCDALTITSNRAAFALDNYKSVPDYMWQILNDYHLSTGNLIGFYGD